MAPSPAGTQHPQLTDVYDASNVYPKLWVGAAPPADRSYPGVQMIVLCAREYQPASFAHFSGQIVRVAIPDDALDTDELRRALSGGMTVGNALKDGKRVLVTCRAGINRSAMVAGLGLLHVTKNAPGGRAMTPDDVIALMRSKRHADCLFNSHFRDYLRRFAATAR